MVKFATMTKMRCVPLVSVILFSLIGVVSVVGESTTDSADDKSTADKAIVHRLYEKVINTGDLDRADELIAVDLRDHNLFIPELAPGLEGFKQGLTLFREAFPDLHFTVGEIMVSGEIVGVRVTMRGTHKGEFLGIPATGKQVKVEGIDLFRIENGVVVERWSAFDRKALMDGLGVVDPMVEAEKKRDHKVVPKARPKPPLLQSMRESSKGNGGAKVTEAKNKPTNSQSEKPPSKSAPTQPPIVPLRKGDSGGTHPQPAIDDRLTDLKNFEQLKEVFQSDIGQVRLIALLSPN